MVSTFLQKRSKGPRPVDIMQLMYSHPASQKPASQEPISSALHSLPRHSRPQSERVRSELPKTESNTTTRTDVLDWALSSLVLPCIDDERETLLSYENNFSIHGDITWDTILSWDAERAQDVVARQVRASELISEPRESLADQWVSIGTCYFRIDIDSVYEPTCS